MDKSYKEQLGRRIKTLRKEAKVNQETIAENVGIDAKSLSRIERGAHYPSLETLEGIGKALHVPLKAFFEFPIDGESEQELRDYLQHQAKTLSLENLRKVVKACREVLG